MLYYAGSGGGSEGRATETAGTASDEGAQHKKKPRTLTLKVVNKTVTNTFHGTNFQASNSRNRLV